MAGRISSRRVFYPRCRAILHVILDGFADTAQDSDEFVIPVLVKGASVHLNSYRQADSFEITFDEDDLRIDPDLIRSAAADVYLYTTPHLGDGRSVSRQFPTIGERSGFMPTFGDPAQARDVGLAPWEFRGDENPIVAGTIDDVSGARDEGGRFITWRGQDYTAWLASMQWPPLPGGRARRIPVGKPLDVLLSDILAEADPRGVLRMKFDESVAHGNFPIVGKNEPAGHGRGIPVDQHTNYWDVMYKLATRHGFILYVQGLDVVLAAPQNLRLPQGDGRVRKLAWGANLESLHVTRKIGKETVPTIVMQGYDPENARTTTVEFPSGKREIHAKNVHIGGAHRKVSTTEKIRAKPVAAKGTKTTTVRKTDEYQIFPVYGVTDPEVLARAAEMVYHLIGRGERKVVAKTADMQDVEDANLLNLRSGDAAMIEFRDINRQLMVDVNVSLEVKFQHLLRLGYNEAVARVVAEHFDRLEGLRRPLRIREVTYDYDVDTGIDIEVEMVDFVVVDGERGAVPDRKPIRTASGRTLPRDLPGRAR